MRRRRRLLLSKTERADSIVHSVNGIDSLTKLQKKLQSEGEVLGSIVALREQGTDLRNNSRFEEALRIHNEGLKQAESIDDTLEWVKALNNIGTDYRRMGVLDLAQSYHYMAWKMCERSTNTSFTAKKNRVMSLNGLGNIYLSLGNYARADSACASLWLVSVNCIVIPGKQSTMPILGLY